MNSLHRRLLALAISGVITVAANTAFSAAIEPSTKAAGTPTSLAAATPDGTATDKSASVSEIGLNEFYKMPIGPRGLEPTAKLLNLNNQRVRLVGYQVKEEEPLAGIFMLSPTPVSLAEMEDGPADDLPAATVFVHMPAADSAKIIAYRAGPWELTGTLQVGNKEESSGRVSYVRLFVEAPAATLPTVKKPKSAAR